MPTSSDKLDFVVTDSGTVVLSRAVKADFRNLRGVLHRPGRKAVSVERMNRDMRKAVSERL